AAAARGKRPAVCLRGRAERRDGAQIPPGKIDAAPRAALSCIALTPCSSGHDRGKIRRAPCTRPSRGPSSTLSQQGAADAIIALYGFRIAMAPRGAYTARLEMRLI